MTPTATMTPEQMAGLRAWAETPGTIAEVLYGKHPNRKTIIALLNGYEALERAREEWIKSVRITQEKMRAAESECERMRVALTEWETWWGNAYLTAKTIGGHPDHGVYAYELSAKRFVDDRPARTTLTKEPNTDARE